MRWLLPVIAVAALASGCKQGVNDRCQVQSDCQDGLLCVLPAGGTPQSGGTCQMSGSGTDMAAASDLAVSGDLGGAPDMTVPADMVATDH